MKLQKKYIKKYGISARAWKEQRKAQGSRKRSVKHMGKKKSYRRSKSSGSFLGIGMDTIWMGVGSGTAGLVGGLVNQAVPQLGGNIAQGVAGLLVHKMGRGALKSIGKGMMIKTIGDLIEENVVPAVMGSSLLGTKTTTESGYLF